MGGSCGTPSMTRLERIKESRGDLCNLDGLRVVEDLRTHRNYKEKNPQEGETIVAFTLRCAAHLISPPMEDGENNEFECIDIAEQVLALEKVVIKRWENS